MDGEIQKEEIGLDGSREREHYTDQFAISASQYNHSVRLSHPIGISMRQVVIPSIDLNRNGHDVIVVLLFSHPECQAVALPNTATCHGFCL